MKDLAVSPVGADAADIRGATLEERARFVPLATGGASFEIRRAYKSRLREE
jgi:hypothetical protein